MKRLVVSIFALFCASSALADVAQCPSQLDAKQLQSSSNIFSTSKAEINVIKSAHDIQLHFVYIDNMGIAHCAYRSDHGLIDVNLKQQFAAATPAKPIRLHANLLGSSNSNWSNGHCSSNNPSSCEFNIHA